MLSICEVASVEQKGREGGIVGEGRRTVRRPGVSSTSLPLKLFYTYNGMHGAEVCAESGSVRGPRNHLGLEAPMKTSGIEGRGCINYPISIGY